MAASKELFDFIKSLSSNEKRNFKLLNISGETEKNYILLFNALDKMEVYDKAELLKKFDDKKFTKNLHVLENYLYKKLLSSLRYFYEDQSVNAQLFNLLHEAEILEFKGFYQLSLEQIRKLEKLAHKHHKYVASIDALPLKARLLAAMNQKNLIEDIEEVYEDAFVALTAIQEELSYQYHKTWMVMKFRKWRTLKEGDMLAEFHDRFQNGLVNQKPVSTSFYPNYYFHAAYYTYYYTLQDYTRALTYQEKVVNLWESHKNILKANVSAYLTQLANYISNAILCKEYEIAEQSIQKMENLKCKTYDEKGEQFQNVYFYKQYYHLNLKDYDQACCLIPAIEKGLKEYNSKVNPARKLNFYYNSMVALFLTEQYEEAVDWLQRILTVTRTDEPRKDIQRFARIFQLAIYYKLSSNKVLENMFRSVYRNKKLKAEMTDFEKLLLTHFKSLLSILPGSRAERQLFADLKVQLDSLDEMNKKILGFEEFYIWTTKMAQ